MALCLPPFSFDLIVWLPNMTLRAFWCLIIWFQKCTFFVPRRVIIEQEWKTSCYLGSGEQNRKQQLGTSPWVRAEAKSIKLSASLPHSPLDTSFKASPPNVKFQKLQTYQRKGNTAQSLFLREFQVIWKQINPKITLQKTLLMHLKDSYIYYRAAYSRLLGIAGSRDAQTASFCEH